MGIWIELCYPDPAPVYSSMNRCIQTSTGLCIQPLQSTSQPQCQWARAKGYLQQDSPQLRQAMAAAAGQEVRRLPTQFQAMLARSL